MDDAWADDDGGGVVVANPMTLPMATAGRALASQPSDDAWDADEVVPSQLTAVADATGPAPQSLTDSAAVQRDESGAPFILDPSTGDRLFLDGEGGRPLVAGWQRYADGDGDVWYGSIISGESAWDPPYHN